MEGNITPDEYRTGPTRGNSLPAVWILSNEEPNVQAAPTIPNTEQTEERIVRLRARADFGYQFS